MAKKASKQKKLDALRKKLKNTDVGGNRGFWSPKTGMSVIRVLPEVGKMEYFFQEVGRHYLPDKKMVYCPSFTTEGEMDCPVCEMVQDLYGIGDAASRKMAGDFRVRKMYWMNVMVRDKETDESTGPFIFTPGVTVFSSIVSLINDPDYGDITDPYEGTDLTLERSGSGINTEYGLVPKRADSLLVSDEDQIDTILEKAKDLSWIEVSDDPEEDQELSEGHAVYVLPYDRIVKEYDLELDAEDLEDYMEEDDEEEEKHPVEKEVKRRRQRRARR